MNKKTFQFLFCTLLGFATIAHSIERVKAPKGWNDDTAGNKRIVSNGKVTITVGPWQSLEGIEAKQWLSNISSVPPSGGEIISSDPIKSEPRVKGAYSILREARFGNKEGYAALFLCPGQKGNARLFTLNSTVSGIRGISHLLKGATFMEQLCKKEPKGAGPSLASQDTFVTTPKNQNEPSTKTTTKSNIANALTITDNELHAINQNIPPANRPTDASLYSYSRFSGFPAQLVFKVGMAAKFKNGLEIACLAWDLASAIDFNELAKDKSCDIPGEKSSNTKMRKFKPGERVNIAFGNISAVGLDGLEGSATAMRGSGLKLNKSGKIELDKWQVGHLSSTAARARSTSTSKNGLVGRYYLDGYTITIVTTDGDTLNGIIGYTLDDNGKYGAVYLNGKHYWDRKKKR